MLSGVAVATTGVAVSSGILATGGSADASAVAASSAPHEQPHGAEGAEGALGVLLADRGRTASRSERRTPIDPAKARALSQQSGGQATRTEDLTGEDPREVARALLADYGFSADQFSCLDALYVSESNWNPHADNPTSSAYGIPQALTGGTHDDLPADYMTNPVAQIRWGLSYIRENYGSPCAAWSFKQYHNWY